MSDVHKVYKFPHPAKAGRSLLSGVHSDRHSGLAGISYPCCKMTHYGILSLFTRAPTASPRLTRGVSTPEKRDFYESIPPRR